MILIIDTSEQKIKISLLDKKKKMIDSLSWKNDRRLSESLLKNIDLLLTRNKIVFNQFEKIVAVEKENPFSLISQRIGLCIGQTMAFALNIPFIIL